MDPSPIPPPSSPRSRFILGPVILICIGVFFLVANLVSAFQPWIVLSRYWPAILILIGLGRLWDYYQFRRYSGSTAAGSQPSASGLVLAVVLLILMLTVLAWHSGRRTSPTTKHDTQTVDLGGATSVTADLQFGAGELDIRGGSSHLLDADLTYDGLASGPWFNYSVTGNHGDLSLSKQGDHTRYDASSEGEWRLAFSNDVPLDLRLNMGAGQSKLDLADLDLAHLQVQMGVGQMDLDLTGPRRHDLDATIHGGIGQARIILPRDVGVRAYASGGLGGVNARGFAKQGDQYVNDAYGKTPTSIDLTVNGGIGEIDLEQR